MACWVDGTAAYCCTARIIAVAVVHGVIGSWVVRGLSLIHI